METEKQFNIIILRPNIQEKSRQQELYGEKYKEFNDTSKYDLWYTISKKRNKAKNKLETYIISLKINSPTIQNLYNQINSVCPEITDRKQFYLYWRYSDSLLLPIFNYITYLTAIQMAAKKNNKFYLVLQEWNDTQTAEGFQYKAASEHISLIKMIASKQDIFRSEEQILIENVKLNANTEFNQTRKIAIAAEKNNKLGKKVKKEIKQYVN